MQHFRAFVACNITGGFVSFLFWLVLYPVAMTQPNTIPPSLDGARERVRRAKQHMESMAREITSLREWDVARTMTEDMVATGRGPDEVEIGPFRLKISIGDSVPGVVDAIQRGMTSRPEDMGSTQVLLDQEVDVKREEWAKRAAREKAEQEEAEKEEKADVIEQEKDSDAEVNEIPGMRSNEDRIDTEPFGLDKIAMDDTPPMGTTPAA
ncbi:MAG: hypothetical protein IIB26_03595, partial [Chloroflexi bacterium]|nr:hypothetical protein [Chloroflexota bacterium]